MKAHPSVQKFIKGFSHKLEIIPNPVRNQPENKFAICQKVMTTKLIADNFAQVIEQNYPVLYVPQGMEIDQRYLVALAANRFKKGEETETQKHFRRQDEIEKVAMDRVEDWARDRGYWEFKNSELGSSKWNMANTTAKDPYEKTMRMQDELGRNLR